MVGNKNTIEQFEVHYIPVTESGCWLWLDYTLPNGYGLFKSNPFTYAHRTSYELYKGPIPQGLSIDHLCRVRCCVNPDHLEAVTQRINVLRGVGRTRWNAEKTHCPQGHLYEGENLVMHHRSRECRICRNKMVRDWRARQQLKKKGVYI